MPLPRKLPCSCASVDSDAPRASVDASGGTAERKRVREAVSRSVQASSTDTGYSGYSRCMDRRMTGPSILPWANFWTRVLRTGSTAKGALSPSTAASTRSPRGTSGARTYGSITQPWWVTADTSAWCFVPPSAPFITSQTTVTFVGAGRPPFTRSLAALMASMSEAAESNPAECMTTSCRSLATSLYCVCIVRFHFASVDRST
mmetsp:Transcript_122561/g.347477  ORF Transcript_122561/g.347477 Transcript_122561/m.347477 type:complete len:203 (+) Transcript_122561:349-957(+)